jgi:ATP/ADP translocase
VFAAAHNHCSLLFVLQLANVLSTEALFYTCIIPFIIFFGSFAFLMYPLRDVLHPTGAQLNQQQSAV